MANLKRNSVITRKVLKEKRKSSIKRINSPMSPLLLLCLMFIALFGKSAQSPQTTKPLKSTTVSSDEQILLTLTGQGPILGNYERTEWSKQTFMQFRGIPYAESPSGKLRFKLPVARSPWDDVLNATQYGRRCPVYTTINALTPEQQEEDLEDCLNLCVFTKDLNVKRPVMVYIHGGGFYNGTAMDHPPHFLMEKDIVLVVVQYRISSFGFISTLTDDIPGNAALGDVLLALQWIQNHISNFGGDPERVTIFGQSAGAAMSSAVLISPRTPSSLFNQVILQSGSILAHWGVVKDPLAQAKRLCENLNCSNCNKIDALNECLIKANVSELLIAAKDEWIGPVLGDFNGILPQIPGELIKRLNRNVSLMAGFTKHDGSYTLGVFYDRTIAQYGSWSKVTVRQFVDGMMDWFNDTTRLANNLEMRLLFPKHILDTNKHAEALPGYFDLNTIQEFKSPAIATTSHLVRKHLGKTFLYSFDYADGEHTRFGYEMGNEHYPFNGGVHHSNDNIYLFPTHVLNERDTRMAKKMVELWTSFAITGTPSTEGDDHDPSMQVGAMENESGPYFRINERITFGDYALDEFTATIDDPNNKELLRDHKTFL